MGRKRKAHKIAVKDRKRKQDNKLEIPDEDLITKDILKKRRTNPNAKITLSGKKRRKILKRLKHAQKDFDEANEDADECMVEIKSEEKNQKKPKPKSKPKKQQKIQINAMECD